MKLTEHIAQHIIDVHDGDNWTDVNITNSLVDVSLTEATTPTPASSNTIAALLHHITFYTEVIMQRLNGNAPVINEANGFDVPILTTEDEWLQLKNNNLQSAQKLADVVKQLPEEKLFQPILENHSTVYKSLHGLVEHAHYHLGQIVLIKKFVRDSAL